MDINGKWGKARALAGLAAIGFVGSVGQYTIQNSKFPDWLSRLFGWLGTYGDSIVSAFMATSIPLWLVTLLGCALAGSLWITLSQYTIDHEKLTSANKELSEKCTSLEASVASLRVESKHANDSRRKAQDELLEARVTRNSALEQAEKTAFAHAKLAQQHEALQVRYEGLEIRLAAVQKQFDSSNLNRVDSTDISPTAVNMVQSYINNQATTGQAATITRIAKDLSYTSSTVQNAINNLTNLGLIRSGTTLRGEKTYLPK